MARYFPHGLPAWLIVALVAAAYSGAPLAGFVWDDETLYLGNRAVMAPTLANVWQSDLWCCSGGDSSPYYRPLLTVSFILDRLCFGLGSVGPHLDSLAWHLGAVVLVRSLLVERAGGVRGTMAALLFGLHPIQSEAVLWLSARNDLMAAVGIFATLWAFDAGFTAIGGGFALAACLSKEQSYLLLLVLPLWRLAWGESVRRNEWFALGSGVAVTLLLRGGAELGSFPSQWHPDFTTSNATFALARTGGWFIWPWPLTATWSLSAPAPGAITCLSALFAVLFAGILVAWGGRRAGALLALSGVLLAPSALSVATYGILGERYLYAPLFGFVAAVVAVWPARTDTASARATVTCAVGFCALSIAAIFVRAPDWANTTSLFAAAVRRAPDSLSWNLLGDAKLSTGESLEAIEAYEHALLSAPANLLGCRYIAGIADGVLNDEDYARRSDVWARAGCAHGPVFDGSRALAFSRRGNWTEAERILREAETDASRLKDVRHRAEIVVGALAARDGDSSSYAALWLAWPKKRTALLDTVADLLQQRDSAR